jgi:CheY-like chemotaxis protein
LFEYNWATFEYQSPERSLRILIVEDNPDAGATLRMILTALGHHLRHVHDGESALDTAEVFKPHAVIMDLGLPGMTGHEAARILRDRPGGEKTLLVAVSGWGRDEDRERSESAGIDAHLVKPLQFEELKALLAAHEPEEP